MKCENGCWKKWDKIRLFLVYSPRERGWTLYHKIFFLCWEVFPAWAGVNLLLRLLTILIASIPRVSGGEPKSESLLSTSNMYSPRERGWTYKIGKFQQRAGVFHAWAGMNLISADLRIPGTSIPRVSGDEPRRAASSFAHASYSPRERGWTQVKPNRRNHAVVFPAWAGVNLA